ncbi:MAG: sulfurtransferase TusA family protein [Candidatus Thalassarchaeaceae archaeon]|tara:strand:+ start:328 stop:567 length:240 start_codon:yes stop_codon:yes gene_type:complete
MADVRVVDVVGFHCPVPVHETRKALSEMESGGVLEVISDDKESLHDIPALCDRMKINLMSVEEDAGEYTFRILKEVMNE